MGIEWRIRYRPSGIARRQDWIVERPADDEKLILYDRIRGHVELELNANARWRLQFLCQVMLRVLTVKFASNHWPHRCIICTVEI